MHDVLDDARVPVAAEVAADRPGRRRGRVGRAGERPEALDDAVSADADRDDGATVYRLTLDARGDTCRADVYDELRLPLPRPPGDGPAVLVDGLGERYRLR